MAEPLSEAAREQLFSGAHTHNGWTSDRITEKTMRALYDLMKWPPTSFNCSPARLVFVVTKMEKERLRPMLMETNQEKSMAAPATVIVAYDKRFYEHLPDIFPAMEGVDALFSGNEDFAEQTAFRNSSIQGGYFILAARALGLDCGPMSGFDSAAVDKAYFPDGRFTANFLCNIGYGDPEGIHPRSPRLDFEKACQIV
ncbi:MAG: malonic semialdehyde reductase [Parvularculales bacterium]